ncbi:hypothetical protein V8C44DRAFT_352685 [Trichoderma aethiopicum]
MVNSTETGAPAVFENRLNNFALTKSGILIQAPPDLGHFIPPDSRVIAVGQKSTHCVISTTSSLSIETSYSISTHSSKALGMHFSYLVTAALVAQSLAAPPKAASSTLQHWLYSSQVDEQSLALLDRPDIVGIQALYSWKSLEPSEGQYDFSAISEDYQKVLAKGKKFWIQLQDRTFSAGNDPVPKYMNTPYYNNGSAPSCDGDSCDTDFEITGWVAQQWNPRVRQRYQALLSALAGEFDGKVTGLNLAETSIAVDENANNYTNESYFLGELENAGYAAKVFKKSYAVQYVNFWPDGWNNTNNRFEDSFNYYAKHGVGVGGPDLIPNKPGQEANSYVYIPKYHCKVPIAVVAVQEKDLEEINQQTGKPFTKEEFVDFAVNELHVEIIFWAVETPWLQSS